jgi:uncharacterized protein (TIGR00369 family)
LDSWQLAEVLMKRQKPVEEKKALRLVRQRMKRSQFAVLLGFLPESIGAGQAVLRMDVKEHHRQLHDVVHGGVLAALADTAAAIAAYTVVARGTEIVTIELKINYLLPVPKGRVKAHASVLRAGRNFIVTECEIRNGKGALAAKALLTFGAAPGHRMQGNSA